MCMSMSQLSASGKPVQPLDLCSHPQMCLLLVLLCTVYEWRDSWQTDTMRRGRERLCGQAGSEKVIDPLAIVRTNVSSLNFKPLVASFSCNNC